VTALLVLLALCPLLLALVCLLLVLVCLFAPATQPLRAVWCPCPVAQALLVALLIFAAAQAHLVLLVMSWWLLEIALDQ